MCYEREKGKIKGRGDDTKGGGRRGGNSNKDFEKAMGQHYFISLLKCIHIIYLLSVIAFNMLY